MKKLPFRSSLSRRLTAVLGVLALILCEQQSNAASQNWTGGSAVDGNWGTVGNWSGGAAPGSTSVLNSADVATFNAAIANTWGNSALNPIVINSATQNISGITFTGSTGSYFIGSTGGNRLFLTNGGTIAITTATAITGTNVIETINAPLQIQGASGATYLFSNASANGTGVGAGTLNFGGGITGVATTGNTTTLTLAGTNTNDNTISGIIGDGSAGGKMALTKNITVGTWVLSGANTYTGATNVNGGLLKVNGATGSISTSGSISIGLTSSGVTGLTSAMLQLDNAAGNLDRIGDSAAVTLFNLGELALIGNTTTSTTETIGALSIGTGSRSSSSTITLSGTASGLLTTLASSGFTRVNNSTALIRGTSLGQQATNATRLTLGSTAGLTFVGTTTANGATPGTAKDVRIVPYLLGDTSASGNGSSFVTYDTTGGLRPLAATEYTTLSAGYTAPTNKENVIAFNGTLTTASPTVNSLLFNTASQTLNGSGVLTVESGAIAAVANTVAIGSGFSSVTLGNGTWNEGILTASSGNTLTINAPIAITGGSGGLLTKTGAGTVIFNAGSSYDAITNVTQGILSIAHNNALGSTVGGTVVNGPSGGRLAIQNNITVAEPLTLIDQGPGNGNVLSVQSGQNTLTGAITASGSNRWSISTASLTVTGGITPTSGNIFFIADATTGGTLKFTTNPLNLGSGGTFYHDTPGLDILAVSGNTWGATSVNGASGAGQSIRTDVANALPSTTTVTIGAGTNIATLDLNGNSQSIVSLASGGTGGTRTLISANTATLTITGNSSTDYAGTLTGALGLTINKSGGTQTLSGATTHTGDTLVSGSTLALGNVNALQGSTLDTGTSGAQAVTFTVAGTNTYNLGGLKGADALAIGGNSISVGANNQSTSYTGVIGTGAGGLTKVGTGALTLGGANSYTGATTVNSGSLILDYTASNTSKLSETAVTGILTLGTATLQLDRSTGASGSHTEAVLSTTINGAASITRGTGSTSVLQMNAITRSAGGSLNLGAASIASTDTNNTNGILGPWATINGTDWAKSVDSGAADTLITAYTAYTDVQRLTPGTIADGSTTNVRLIEGSGSAGNIALGAATTTINTLNQSTTSGTSAAIIDAAGKTLAVNGILVGSGAGALTIGTAAGSGTLQTATAGGELAIHHYGSSNLTLNSVIANNTSASGLTQSGTGTTVLAGTNTFTGKTILNGGKLSIAAETGLGSNPSGSTADQLTLNGGTLLTTATLAIDDTNRGITLGAAGGTFEVSTGTTTIAATSIIAGSGGFTKTGAGQLTLSGTANTYTGPTTISAGILSVSRLGNGGANSALGAATKANTNLVFDGGTLQYTGTTANGTSDRFFTINAGKTATIDVSATTFGISGAGTTVLTLGGGAAATTGALTKIGTGTLSLTSGSDYTGATTVSAGTLLIGANNALGSAAGTTTVANLAMLQLQGSITVAENITINGNGTSNSGSLRSDSGANTLTGLLTLGSAGNTRIRSDGGSLTLSGGVSRPSGISTDAFQVISGSAAGSGFISFDTTPINIGAGRIETVGQGQTRIAVAGNTYGLLQVAWGSFTRLDVANALNASSILEIGTGASSGGSSYTGSLDLFGNSQTVAELRTGANSIGQAGTRTIGSVAPATLTVNQSTTSTYDGALTGALALTKSGSGTLTLTGVSTTTGATTVSGGTLALDFTAFANASGNQSHHIAPASALQLGGGTLSVKGVANSAAVSATAWTAQASAGTNLYSLTFGTTPAVVVGQPITGTSLTGAYVVSVDSTNKKVTVFSTTAPNATGSDFAATATTTTTTSQTFASTTLNPGASAVTVNANSGSGTVLNLGAITRNAGGTVNFTLPSGTQSSTNGITTSTTNTNGLLGNGLGWATVGGTDFATNSTNAAGGNIVAYTGYTDVTRFASGTKIIPNTSTANIRIIEGSTGSNANITLAAATTTINTLNQSTSGGSSAAIIDPAGQTLQTNSILVGSGAGGLTIGTGTNNGTLSTATSGGDLLIQHYGSNSLTINSVIADNTSASNLVKTGSGTLVLTGTNTFSGTTSIFEGTVSVSSLNNASANGVLGNSSSAIVLGSGATSGRLQLTGDTALSTNRDFSLGAAGGVVDSLITNTATSTLSGSISGSGSLTKTGTGTLTLSGTNTYTGTTTIKGSQLVLDYSGLSNTTDPLSTGAVTLDMGTLTLKGKTSGTTTETISTLNIGSNLGSANTLRLDANGGSGLALTVSTFGMATIATNTQNINLIDLSSSASNTINVTALGATAKVYNGVLMQDNGASSGRANLVVRDSSGYGFATLTGASSGTIGRLSTGTTLDATTSSSTTNFRLITSGTLTRTADLDYSTITLDSTAGAVTLAMGANNLAPSGNGRGILITGPNDVSITGSGRLEGAASTWFHNYSTGTFTYGLSTASSGTAASLMFGGSGLTVWTGTSTTKANGDSLYIEGGIFRPTTAQDWSSAGSLGIKLGGVWVSSGGVLEVGADLNATTGDLSNTVGNTAGNIRFWGSSGVSASGTNRTVNFGGGTSLTWGSSSFLTDAGGSGDGNYAFKLSSDKSDSTVTVQNNIALGSLNRTVEVANGSAATDATLSGVLSGAGGLVKSGAGTLSLPNNNTYSGTTSVSGGSLQVGSNGSGRTGTGAVTVQTGSVILGTGVIQGTTFTADNGSTLRPGDSVADSSHGTLTFTPATASGSTSNLQGSIILGISTPTITDATFGGNIIGSAGYNAWVDAISGTGSHDRLVFSNPGSGTGYNLNFLTTTGSLQVVGSSFTPAMGQAFNLLDWASLVNPNFTGFTFNSGYLTGNGDEGADLDLPDITASGLRWDFSRFTTSGVVLIVPEPSRALLFLFGFVGLVTRRRRF